MAAEKDYIDKIIDLFIECHKIIRNEDYFVKTGKKHYYYSVDRSHVAYLVSYYRSQKPDADTETALKDFGALFNLILRHKHNSAYLNTVSLYKVCFKLPEYKASLKQIPTLKKEFDIENNSWAGVQNNVNLLGSGSSVAIQTKPDVCGITKLPQPKRLQYSADEISVIRYELLRLAKARNENYPVAVVDEWIESFSELNYSCSKVVKIIKLVKITQEYSNTKFGDFMKVDLNEFYIKYPSERKTDY